MKAAVLQDWREIAVEEVERPPIGDHEALLRVVYTGVCGSDVHIFNGTNPIARTPLVPGHEFFGHVAAANGALPDSIRVGDRVVAQPLVSCGHCPACDRGLPHVCASLIVIGVNQDGGFAEFVRVPAEKLIAVPEALPDEVAALTEPFAVGHHACRRTGLRDGESVLIVGCGPIGLYAAIMARQLGAASVVVSEPLAERRAFAESFGFTAIDPGLSSGLHDLRAQTGNRGFDVVIETSGVDAGLNCAVEAAAVRARIVSLGFPAGNVAAYNVTRAIVKELSLIGSRVYPLDEFAGTLAHLETLFATGAVDFSRIVTSVRGLDDLGRSISDVATGRERGKILIRPE